MRRIPDFFVIGAAKSGTTSLYHYLNQHQSIYMPKVKEPNFLAYWHRTLNLKGPVGQQRVKSTLYMHTITSEQTYFSLFEAAGPGQITGESSPRYLYYPDAIRNLAQIAPSAKLIVLLRDPVLRAHSHYRMNREFNLEPCRSFEKALKLEPSRVAKGYGWDWHYLGVSRYGSQIQYLLRYFSKEQLFVTTYENFTAFPEITCRQICEFLGVSDDIEFNFSERHKVSKSASGWLGASLNHTRLSPTARYARSVIPRKMARRIKYWLLDKLEQRGQSSQRISATTYLETKENLRDDIRLLEELVPVDTMPWKLNEQRFFESLSKGKEQLLVLPPKDQLTKRENPL